MISVESTVGKGARVKDSVLLPGATVEDGAIVNRAILGENSVIRAGAVFGSEDPKVPIAVIGDDFIVEKGGEE